MTAPAKVKHAPEAASAASGLSAAIDELLARSAYAGVAELFAALRFRRLPAEITVRDALFPENRCMPWTIIEELLDELGATRADRKRCETYFRTLERHGLAPKYFMVPRGASPDHRVASVVNTAREEHAREARPRELRDVADQAGFLKALRDLRSVGRVSLRDIEGKMREQDPKHAWGKSALGDLLADRTMSLPSKPRHMYNLIAVLCAEAGHSKEKVRAYFAVYTEVLNSSGESSPETLANSTEVSSVPRSPHGDFSSRRWRSLFGEASAVLITALVATNAMWAALVVMFVVGVF
ncbi:hypothetical protein [Prauserella muralis]|uniref:Uncharacterized protein n=1 Tax=Prauserella muralis TaxID=588067 RepID=A0A2V4APK8_9PSEU|nr:hypothetical protein [Prauserella muralis]PXY16601.1 hypothetical protein BAY60_36015 [Prauserella muralis]TWE11153.1 hypothetical protein FHX69_7372 [Prauserella muralis]